MLKNCFDRYFWRVFSFDFFCWWRFSFKHCPPGKSVPTLFQKRALFEPSAPQTIWEILNIIPHSTWRLSIAIHRPKGSDQVTTIKNFAFWVVAGGPKSPFCSVLCVRSVTRVQGRQKMRKKDVLWIFYKNKTFKFFRTLWNEERELVAINDNLICPNVSILIKIGYGDPPPNWNILGTYGIPKCFNSGGFDKGWGWLFLRSKKNNFGPSGQKRATWTQEANLPMFPDPVVGGGVN